MQEYRKHGSWIMDAMHVESNRNLKHRNVQYLLFSCARGETQEFF
jgi:hypothetical protein